MRRSQMSIVQCNTAADTQIVGPSTTRKGLILAPGAISSTGASQVYRANCRIMQTVQDGFAFPGFIALILTLEEHGDIVQHDWHAWVIPAGCTLAVIEIF